MAAGVAMSATLVASDSLPNSARVMGLREAHALTSAAINSSAAVHAQQAKSNRATAVSSSGGQKQSTFQARTADSSNAAALFASHSWYVPPPPPPPVAPPPPPPATAPPFPYTYVGSYAPAGETPVYFLTRGDRVIDARVGERLDGVYDFESVGPDGLVFNYLPLNMRQSVPTGVSQ
jgi:hypothetical protein